VLGVSALLTHRDSARKRLILADDNLALLDHLREILEPYADVVSVAVDGEDLLRQVGTMLPSVVVTDISMPKMNGLDACIHIRRMYPGIDIIVVSELVDDALTAVALKLGASAAIRKSRMSLELPAAVLALS
jgi:two-component system response regulator NreC